MLNITKSATIQRGSLKVNKKKVDYNASTIPNVTLWFDANVGSMSSLTTTASVGNKVFGWKNRLTGQIRTAQSNVSEQPILTDLPSGNKCIRFSGTQWFDAYGGGFPFPAVNDYTVVSVVRRTRTAGSNLDYIFSSDNGVRANFQGVINDLSGSFKIGLQQPNGTSTFYKNGSTTNTTIGLDETCVVCITTSGGVTVQTGSPWYIGYGYVRFDNYHLQGDIAELILIARTVPQSEIVQITNGLKLKYEL